MFLLVITVGSLVPGLFTKGSYDAQHRRNPNEPPNHEYLLGTDELGRDRFTRLIYGARTSLLLAPAAAMLATAIAAIAGIMTNCFVPLRRPILLIVDVMVSTPLIFLLLMTRAWLPLDVSAAVSVSITFVLLGLLGWAPAVRVFAASAQASAESEFILQARAGGCRPLRILMRHLLPNLAPVVLTQFCVLVPVFVLAEANLSILGLGVSEPLPSLGNLMADLLNYSLVLEQPWLLIPAVLLFCITGSLHILRIKVS